MHIDLRYALSISAWAVDFGDSRRLPGHPMTGEQPISSPCIQVCAVSGETGFCIGCGRTLREIAAWRSLTEQERMAIMETLPGRLQNMAPA
jgi:uncharacterized protein